MFILTRKSVIAAAFAIAAVLPFSAGAASVSAGAGASLGGGPPTLGADATVNGAVNAPSASGSATVGSAIRMEKLDASTATNADMGASMERPLSAPGFAAKGDAKARGQLDKNRPGLPAEESVRSGASPAVR
jgi:hypothetical protein